MTFSMNLISSCDYKTSCERRIIHEWWIWKDVQGIDRILIWATMPTYASRGWGTPGTPWVRAVSLRAWQWNCRPPEHEAGVPPIPQRRSMHFYLLLCVMAHVFSCGPSLHLFYPEGPHSCHASWGDRGHKWMEFRVEHRLFSLTVSWVL
jgi:hypothetical protein